MFAKVGALLQASEMKLSNGTIVDVIL